MSSVNLHLFRLHLCCLHKVVFPSAGRGLMDIETPRIIQNLQIYDAS